MTPDVSENSLNELISNMYCVYTPDALAGFKRPVGDDGMVADDRLARGQDLGRVVRVPRPIPARDKRFKG